MNREDFIKKLHPAITHVRASDEMSDDMLEAINLMVDKVSKMSTMELKSLLAQSRIPDGVKEAKKYMSDCESDMGFMGSPAYTVAKNYVDEYYRKSLTP